MNSATLSSHTESREKLHRSETIEKIISLEEIDRAIRMVCRAYENIEEVVYRRVIESRYYRMLVGGTVSDLIGFMRNFENKNACGYAHETGMRVGSILLTPENCTKKDGYAACGHPELNGLLLAEVLAELLLDHAYPVRRQVARIGRPMFESLSLADTGSARYYEGEKIKKPSGTAIPIWDSIRVLQSGFGEQVHEELQHIATMLEGAYA